MSKDNNNTNREQWPSHAWQELRYMRGTSIATLMLAMGTMVTMFLLGNQVAETMGAGPTAAMFLRNLFVFIGFGIDYAFISALKGARSSVSTGRTIWILVGMALVGTLGCSMVSNLFVSEQLAGESNLPVYQQELLNRRLQDSTDKARAYELLANAGEEERLRLQQANEQRSAKLRSAIAAGSPRWQADYQKAKDNARAWFWTCQRCPLEYREYRDGIRRAIEEGDAQVAQAQGYTSQIAGIVSPTLSSNISQDSSLVELKTVTLSIEAQRQRRQAMLRWVFVVVTVFAAAISIVVTIVLREHRKEHGQYVPEDDGDVILLAFDLFNRSFSLLVDLFYNTIFRLSEYAQQRGWLRHYAFSNSRWDVETQGTNGQQADQHQQSTGAGATTNTNNQQHRQQADTNSDQQEQANSETPPPTDDTNSGGKDCRSGRCAPGKSRTVPKQERLTTDAREMVRIAERCRLRWKRSFSSATEGARNNNHQGAEEDAQWLRLHGATVNLNKSSKTAEIILPKQEV